MMYSRLGVKFVILSSGSIDESKCGISNEKTLDTVLLKILEISLHSGVK